MLGEAPGKVEDQYGLPFVGPVGRYLKTKLARFGILQAAVFMNSVSCWPVGETDLKPTAAQSKSCRGNLKAQLDQVTESPFVLSVGAYATRALIRHQESIKHVLGVWVPLHGKIIFPILHPGFILRVADPTLEKKWVSDIYRFAETIKLQSEPAVLLDFERPRFCIYCGAEKHPSSEYTCFTHRKEWRLDQAWDPSGTRKRKVHPDQGSMF